MGVGKFWHDLEIEVFLMGLEVSFPAKFFNASRSLEFFCRRVSDQLADLSFFLSVSVL